MKKFVSLAILAVAVVAVSGAQAPKKDSTPKTITCAVMGGKPFEIATATKNHMYADYKGKRYFFCCGGCPQAFKKDPAKYAKGPSIPTPKATKK